MNKSGSGTTLTGGICTTHPTASAAISRKKNPVLGVQMQVSVPTCHPKVLTLLVTALSVPCARKILQCSHLPAGTASETEQLPLAPAAVHTSDGNFAAYDTKQMLMGNKR